MGSSAAAFIINVIFLFTLVSLVSSYSPNTCRGGEQKMDGRMEGCLYDKVICSMGDIKSKIICSPDPVSPGVVVVL